MYRFSLDIVKTLPIYYLMLLEYMWAVTKLLTIRNSRKLSLKKQLKNRLNTEFPMLRENWPTFFITVDKYFLSLQSNSFVRLKAVLHFISRILEAIDHPVSEIKNYNDCHIEFCVKTPEYYGEIGRCDTGKGGEYGHVIFECHRWRFWRILKQMIQIMIDLYMGPCLSPIKYGTTHGNHLNQIN